MLLTTRKTTILLRAVAMAALALAVALPAIRMKGKSMPLPLVRKDPLRHTVVAPTMEQPIVPGRSVLWCGSYQLAWNELMAMAGGPLELTPEYSGTEWLNRSYLTGDDVQPGSVLTHTGIGASLGELREHVKTEIPGARPYALAQADKQLEEISGGPVAYAYMRAGISFSAPYERLGETVTFNEHRVRAFGYTPEDPGPEMRDQTQLLDYRSRDDFVLELTTPDEQDRVILAKVPAETTLQSTVESVLARSNPDERLPAPDELRIPLMNFAVDHRFASIEGREARGPERNLGPIMLAGQGIRFRMDERGVVLETDAMIAAGSDMAQEPPVCIFDKPFLLMLKRRGDHPPYFAFWVDNAELLFEVD
jgi:hypothetical protein